MTRQAVYRQYGLMLVGTVARDDLGSALGQQIETDRAAEFARPVGRTAPRRFDEALAGLVKNGSGERHIVAVKRRVTGNRRVAVAVQHPQHLALGLGAQPRSHILDLRQALAR